MPENAPPRDVPRNLKPYFLCFLVKAELWNQPEGAEALAAAQLAFLRAEIEAGRCKFAGPVGGGGSVVGFSLWEAADAAAALALARRDPAVAAGRVEAQVLPVILPSVDGVRVEFANT